jgi:pyruvate,orthophosphate dikinase
MAKKYVYLFREGDRGMRNLLGGKGANLAEMTNIGLNVPFGFTLTTEVCREYYEGGETFPPGLWEQVAPAVADVEKAQQSILRADKKLEAEGKIVIGKGDGGDQFV